MKILVNCSNIKVGGAIQVSLSFLDEIKNNFDHEFYVVLSSHIYSEFENVGYSDNFHFFQHTVQASVTNVVFGSDSFLTKLENDIKPDVVFSVFGPTYWKPTSRHIVGFAKAQYIYKNESPFYRNLSMLDKLLLRCKEVLQMYDFKHFASEFITENREVSYRLGMKVHPKKVHTVTNNCSSLYYKEEMWNNSIKLPKYSGTTLLTISANYPHKNLRIVTKVIEYIKRTSPRFECRFVLTLEENEFSDLDQTTKDSIIFLGKVKVSQCPYLYKQSDIMFLPTLLECFSASYPEAMKMGVPILTSNLEFARGICSDAAYYINPLSPEEIGDAIIRISNDETLKNSLIEAGKKRLSSFDTAQQRAQKYLSILINETNYSGS